MKASLNQLGTPNQMQVLPVTTYGLSQRAKLTFYNLSFH